MKKGAGVVLQQDSMVQNEPISPLPPAPRHLTPRARRRAWAQPSVRFWWLTGLALTAIAAGFTFVALKQWNHERWLIAHGTAVNAIVQQAGEQTLPGRKQPPDTICILKFDWHGQPHITRPDALAGRTEYVAPQDVVKIFVNPDNPDDWTAGSQAGALMPRLFGAMIAMSVGLAAFVVSYGVRSRTLGMWRNGELIEAMVVSSHNTALAPRSLAMRCTPADDGDRRLFTVYVPPSFAQLMPGDPLWIITASRKSSRAQAVAWFE